MNRDKKRWKYKWYVNNMYNNNDDLIYDYFWLFSFSI
jgi:hypothetical protein